MYLWPFPTEFSCNYALNAFPRTADGCCDGHSGLTLVKIIKLICRDGLGYIDTGKCDDKLFCSF